MKQYLFPGSAELDLGFRQEIDRLSSKGLFITGALQICVSAFLLLARFVLSPASSALSLRFVQGGFIVGLGVINIFASRLPQLARWARAIGWMSGLLTAAILIWSSMISMAVSTNPNDFIPGQITLILLIAITCFPLLPMQTLALGIATGIAYVVSANIAERSLTAGLGPDPNYELFITMLTLLCTGITAVLYAQRFSNYSILKQTVEAADALRDVQTRVVMSESAATLSRLAAAVSHEMNNPLGALLSGVDTLLLLASRQSTTTPEQVPRLLKMQNDLRRSIQDSAQRIRELIGRMQRFTNLDQAEVQSIDINELLKDVVALVDPAFKRDISVEMNLLPLTPLTCKPQQLSIVFSSLLHNAVSAVNGDGRVVVASKQEEGRVHVTIEDNGRGLSSDDLRSIFDPDFRTTGVRIASANWGMFNSRQIVREHGGEIDIQSRVGKGTRVDVSLPIENAVT